VGSNERSLKNVKNNVSLQQSSESSVPDKGNIFSFGKGSQHGNINSLEPLNMFQSRLIVLKQHMEKSQSQQQSHIDSLQEVAKGIGFTQSEALHNLQSNITHQKNGKLLSTDKPISMTSMELGVHLKPMSFGTSPHINNSDSKDSEVSSRNFIYVTKQFVIGTRREYWSHLEFYF
jgi:hypothetical protein